MGIHDLPKTFPACESVSGLPCCWISSSEQPGPWSTDAGTSSVAQGADQCPVMFLASCKEQTGPFAVSEDRVFCVRLLLRTLILVAVTLPTQ